MSIEDWTPVSAREARVVNIRNSWHNPTGHALRQLSENVWVMERGYYVHMIDCGGKMTIIRLPDRRLFIHSPLPIDAELKREIESLGNVSAVVAPNTQHVDFIGHWKKHFPSAVCLGPPGCIANRTDVPFDAELNVDESAHESYADEYGSLEQIYVPGSEMMGETIFYHPSSKTLLVTDLIFTFGKEGVPRGVRWGHGFLTAVWWWLYTWFLQRDKQAFRRMLVRIEQLDYETLVPTHGSVVGRSQAEAAFKDWFRA